ncbi:MAG: kelch repeat-containing protein [Methanomassiliicoccales archaeon]
MVRMMMKKVLALALALMMGIGLLTAIPGAQAAGYDWAIEGSIPDDRTSFVCAELPDGRFFVAFGYDSTDAVRRNDAGILDPDGWSWTSLTDAPTALESPTGVYLDGKVFVFGGINSGGYQDSVLIYTLATDTWSTSQDLPYEGTFMRSVAIDDENILLVGSDSSEDECYLFNIDTEVFTQVGSMPEGRGGGGLAKMGGTVYYFGGWYAGLIRDDIFAYDIAADNWTAVGKLPEPRTGMSAVAADNGLIYLFGGGAGIVWISNNVKDAMVWNPDDGLFSMLPEIPHAERYGAAVQVDSRVVIFGGHDLNHGVNGIYSLETVRLMAEVSAPSVVQGDSAWVHVWAEADMEIDESLSGYLYLTRNDVTYGGWYFSSATGDEIMLEIPVPENLPAGEYRIEFSYVSIDAWSMQWKFAPLTLSVIEAPSTDEQLQELSEQNQALQDKLAALNDDLDDTRAELAEVKESADSKLDAMIGYVILILVIVTLVVAVLVLVRKK